MQLAGQAQHFEQRRRLGARRIQTHLVQPAQLAIESVRPRHPPSSHADMSAILRTHEHRITTLTYGDMDAPCSDALRDAQRLLRPTAIVGFRGDPGVGRSHPCSLPWTCTYRAGAVRFGYDATYAYDHDILRQIASWAGGGDEELLAYDTKRGGWTAVVLDDHGSATVMRASGSDPNHIAYRSVYPDTSIATTFDRISATEYTMHATVRSGGKTITSVDTCVRAAR